MGQAGEIAYVVLPPWAPGWLPPLFQSLNESAGSGVEVFDLNEEDAEEFARRAEAAGTEAEAEAAAAGHGEELAPVVVPLVMMLGRPAAAAGARAAAGWIGKAAAAGAAGQAGVDVYNWVKGRV